MAAVDPCVPDIEIIKNGNLVGWFGEMSTELANKLCDRINTEAQARCRFDWCRQYTGDVELHCIGDALLARDLLTKHIREWFRDAAQQSHRDKYPGLEYSIAEMQYRFPWYRV